MTGWAIIGCGMIAKFHARAIAEIKGSKLVACHSRSMGKATEFANAFGGTAYDDLAKMFANPAIDIVTICTPSGAHLEPGVAAAKAGKHVLVEKPLEVTAARCDRLIEACSKSAYVKWFRTQAYYDSGKWRGTWKLDGGGALMNQAIHSVDLLLWLMGPVRSVSAMAALRAHERIEVEDTLTAILEFESGALGTIEATTAAYPGTLKRIEIAGSVGSATLEEEAIKQWDFAKPNKSDAKILEQMDSNVTGGGAADPTAIGHRAHRDLFASFLQGIKKGTPCSIDGIEGRKSVDLICAIYKSAKSGKRTHLS